MLSIPSTTSLLAVQHTNQILNRLLISDIFVSTTHFSSEFDIVVTSEMQIIYVVLISHSQHKHNALMLVCLKKIELIELMFYLSRGWHQNGNRYDDDEEVTITTILATAAIKTVQKRLQIMPLRDVEENIDLRNN